MKLLKKVQVIVFRKSPSIEFLILKTSRKWSQSIWQGVTGGVEKFDEDLRTAALRELKEELSINSDREKLIGPLHEFTFTTQRRGYEGTTATEYCFGYEVSGDYEVKLSDEHSEYKWLPFKDAVKLIDYEDSKKVLTLINKIYS